MLGRAGRVVVMMGDGELQEGQNWEALQAAAHERLGDLWVVVDRNELQSDKPTEEIVALGELEAKLEAFGWHVASCDGHDHAALRGVFEGFRDGAADAPKALVAQTIKGKGVSFMEHPVALAEGGGTYRWHAGAPDDESFDARVRGARRQRIRGRLAALGLELAALRAGRGEEADAHAASRASRESGAGHAPRAVTDEYVVEAYGEALLELGEREDRLVVLDADLASDCRVRAFELAYPDRFVECGIAEQDMVSTAAGLARHGFLPVVNSFASFLASRANEQIYNQASEGRRSSTPSTTPASSRPARASRTRACATSRSSPRSPARRSCSRPARRRRARSSRWAVEDADGERRDPARDRAVASPDRAAGGLPAGGRAGHRAARRAVTACSSPTGR